MKKIVHVYVTTIEHRHGRNIYVNKTETGAYKEVEQYVIDNWTGELPAENYKKESAVEQYFHSVEEEFFDIEFCELGK